MKTQYISVSSKECDDQWCQRLSEDQWASCLLTFLLKILLIFDWINEESDDQGCQKGFWRSMSIMPVDFLASNPFSIWLDKCARQVFTECLLLKPDW